MQKDSLPTIHNPIRYCNSYLQRSCIDHSEHKRKDYTKRRTEKDKKNRNDNENAHTTRKSTEKLSNLYRRNRKGDSFIYKINTPLRRCLFIYLFFHLFFFASARASLQSIHCDFLWCLVLFVVRITHWALCFYLHLSGVLCMYNIRFVWLCICFYCGCIASVFGCCYDEFSNGILVLYIFAHCETKRKAHALILATKPHL